MICVDEIFARLSTWAFRHAWGVLAMTLLVTLGAAWAGSRLTINADLSSLLPESAPSVVALRTAEREVGTRSSLTVYASGGSEAALKQFAQEAKTTLEAIPGMGEVQYKKPVDFFKAHALYYMDLDQLERLEDQLGARKKFEVRQKNPLFVGLGAKKEAPKIDLDAVFGPPKKGASSHESRAWLDAQLQNPHYMSQDAILLVAKPTAPSLDLAESKRLVSHAREVLARIDLAKFGPSFRAHLGGSHTKRVEQQEQISADLGLTSLVAMMLIVLYLGFYFRRIGAIALVLIPLGLGITWTYGFASLAFGELNILTAFVSVILLGLGIDHGVHLVTRFGELHSDRAHAEHALGRAFAHTGRGVFIAALTTMVGFGALSLSHFRVFEEFGVLASMGVLFITLMYLVVLPAMIRVALGMKWRPVDTQSEATKPFFALVVRHSRKIVVAATILMAGLLLWLPALRFEYNSRVMAGDLPSFEVDRQSDELLGRSQSPMLVLTKNAEHTLQLTRELEARKAAQGETSSIHFISSASALIPETQQQKEPFVKEIHRILQDVDLDDVPQKDRPLIDALMAQERAPTPFGFKDLPSSVQVEFSGHGGSMHDRLLFIYSQVDLSDGRQALKFNKEVAGLQVTQGAHTEHYYAVGAPLILADVLIYVFSETPKIVVWVMILMFLALFLSLRHLRATLIAQGTAVITLLVSGAMMGLFDVQFNYINIIIIAAAFGLSVDGAVHLIHDTLKQGGLNARGAYRIGRANAGALITTGLGFGAMKLAHNPGITSLANAAILTLIVNLVLTVVVLPAFLHQINFGRPKAAS